MTNEIGMTESEMWELLLGHRAAWQAVMTQCATAAANAALRLVWAALVVVAGWVVVKVSRWLSAKWLQKSVASATVRAWLQNAVAAALWVITAMVVLEVLGMSALSVATFILSLGVATGGIVANFVAGVLLVIWRKVKVGDHVCVGGSAAAPAAEGIIMRIDMFDTELEATGDKLVIVPNATLVTSIVWNSSRLASRRQQQQQQQSKASSSGGNVGHRIIRALKRDTTTVSSTPSTSKDHDSDADDDSADGEGYSAPAISVMATETTPLVLTTFTATTTTASSTSTSDGNVQQPPPASSGDPSSSSLL